MPDDLDRAGLGAAAEAIKTADFADHPGAIGDDDAMCAVLAIAAIRAYLAAAKPAERAAEEMRERCIAVGEQHIAAAQKRKSRLPQVRMLVEEIRNLPLTKDPT